MPIVETVAALGPSLGLLALGRLMRERVGPAGWRGLDRLNYELLMPVLLLTAAASRPIEAEDAVVMGVGGMSTVAVGGLLAALVRPSGPATSLDRAAASQVAWRFNTALGFVAVATLDPDLAGLMAVAVGFAVPTANLLAVGALARGRGLGLSGAAKRVARNPFLLASLAGLALGLSGADMPEPLVLCLGGLADAALPLALLAVGAILEPRALARLDAPAAALAGIKLVALPALAALAVLALDVEADRATVLIVFAALPTAVSAHVLAAAFGADPARPAALIAQSTLLAAVTLPVWMTLARSIRA